MDTYEVELEAADPSGFAATIPVVPGLLVLGSSVDEVLEHARAAIDFYVGGVPGERAPLIAVKPSSAARPAQNCS